MILVGAVLLGGATRKFLVGSNGGGPCKTIVVHGGDLVAMGSAARRTTTRFPSRSSPPARA
jgi:alkylated DNA repair dioxygenase AlkB